MIIEFLPGHYWHLTDIESHDIYFHGCQLWPWRMPLRKYSGFVSEQRGGNIVRSVVSVNRPLKYFVQPLTAIFFS